MEIYQLKAFVTAARLGNLTRTAEVLHLTPIEYKLLTHLASQPDRVITHAQLLKAEAEQSGFDDLLVCDQRGYATELCAANLFFKLNGQWCTPKLDQAGVAGVMRQWLLQHLDVQQGYFPLTALDDATAMFASNALMGVVPVRQFQQRLLNLDEVRPIQQLVPFLAGKISC